MSVDGVPEELILKIIKETAFIINSMEDLSPVQEGIKFENYVFETMREIAGKNNVSIEQTGAQSFPDIIVGGTYGVEVKFSIFKPFFNPKNK